MGVVSASDEGPLIQIIVWMLVATFVCAWIMRIIVKASNSGIYAVVSSLDDWLLVVGVALSIAQSGAVSSQALHGLGREASGLPKEELKSSLKAGYAADLLYLTSVCSTKLSAVFMYYTLTPAKTHHKTLYLLAAFIATWVSIGFVGTAFQCHLPNPWDYVDSQCMNLTAWWIYLEVMNIASEGTLVVFSVYLVATRLHLSRLKKLGLSLLFVIRISVVVACACKIYFWVAQRRTSDVFVSQWPITICNEVIQCLGILTVCILHFRQFVIQLETGFMANDDVRRRGNINLHGFDLMPSPQHSGSTKTLHSSTQRAHPSG